MALTVAELNARLLFDVSKFQDGIDKAEAKTSSFSQKMSKAGDKLTKGVTLPLLGAATAAFKMGSDLQESLNAADVAFKDDSKAVKKWAKELDAAFGFTQREALDSVAAFKLVTQQSKFTAEQYTDLAERAADLGSVFNASSKDVSEAIKSGLVGETEPLRRFGVVLSQARIEAQAMSMGLIKTSVDMEKVTQRTIAVEQATLKYNNAVKKYGDESDQASIASKQLELANMKLQAAIGGAADDMTDAQKQAATLALIMKDTSFAQGDAANTADTAAGKMRVLKAEMGRLAEDIGTKLIPIGVSLLEKVQGLVSWFGNLSGGQQDMILKVGLLVAAIGPLIKVIESLQKAWVLLNATIKASPLLTIAGVMTGIYVAAEKLWGGFDGITRSVTDLNGQVQDLKRTFTDFFKFANEQSGKALFGDGLFSGNPLKKLPFIGGIFHDGGVVPGPRGADVPIMAQAGETVIPAGMSAGGGTTINIMVAGDTDPDGAARRIHELLLRQQRRTGSLGFN